MTDLVSVDGSSPPADAPAYEITSGDDGVLQWKPPIGSIELALSLSYHFPRQETLEDKMKAAILRYIRASKKRAAQQSSRGSLSEGQTKFKVAPPQMQVIAGDSLRTQPPPAPHDNDVGSQTLKYTQTVWDARTGEQLMGKPKRRYTEDEKAAIIRNRGKACDDHRRAKRQCSAVTCTQNKQHEKYGLKHDKNVSEITLGSKFDGNSGIHKNNSGVLSIQKGLVLDVSHESLRQSSDQDEPLDQGRGLWNWLQEFANFDEIPSSAFQQLGPLQVSGNNFLSDVDSEALGDADNTGCFSTEPDLEWDEHTYFDAYPTSYDETSLVVMGEVSLQTKHEAPGPDLRSQPAESSTSNVLTSLLQVTPEGEPPAVVGQGISEEVGGLAYDPIDVKIIPETIALPQLENSRTARSYGCGGGGSGSGRGKRKASNSSRRSDCNVPKARTMLYRSSESNQIGRIPIVCSENDEMPYLTRMMEYTSIWNY